MRSEGVSASDPRHADFHAAEHRTSRGVETLIHTRANEPQTLIHTRTDKTRLNRHGVCAKTLARLQMDKLARTRSTRGENTQ